MMVAGKGKRRKRVQLLFATPRFQSRTGVRRITDFTVAPASRRQSCGRLARTPSPGT